MRKLVRSHIANWLQTLVFLGLLIGLAAIVMWFLLGGGAAFVGVGLIIVYLTRSTTVAASQVLQALGANPVPSWEYPELQEMVLNLARRSGIESVVRIHVIPTYAINAFSTGSRREPHLAITWGLVQALTLRELRGVVAHEIAHIANNDLKILELSRYAGRIMSLLSLVGQVILFLNLPLILFGLVALPSSMVLLIGLGPTLVLLLQLKITRVREFQADAAAIGLTHDPEGLISALLKMDEVSSFHFAPWLARVPSARVPEWLRTHPSTVKRIARLRSLRNAPA